MKLAPDRAQQVSARRGERGYSLLAILAGLTISLIIIAGALPAIQHEMQREKEEEMFWRAEQVMFAISMFRMMNGNRYPTSLEELTRPQGLKGIHLVRPSAMTDPMTGKPWRPVRVGDPLLVDFIHTIQIYLQRHPAEAALYPMSPGVRLPPPGTPNALLPLNDPASTLLLEFPQLRPEAKIDTGISFDTPGPATPPNEQAPIVGIVSGSNRKVIRNYYDIETYDHCIFVRAAGPMQVTLTSPINGLPGSYPGYMALRMPGQYSPPVRLISQNSPLDTGPAQIR
ncbi:MAG: hypothetical protein U0Z53_19865 [Blastocatellia bacterium]